MADKLRGYSAEERRAKGISMLAEGLTYRAIVAAEIGYNNPQTAWKDLHAEWATIRAELSDDRKGMVATILARLDVGLDAARAVIEGDHPLVSDGRIVKDENGKPLQDVAPLLNAIDRVNRLDEVRRKLLGLDAATKVEASQMVTYQLVGVDPDEV